MIVAVILAATLCRMQVTMHGGILGYALPRFDRIMRTHERKHSFEPLFPGSKNDATHAMATTQCASLSLAVLAILGI